MIATARDQIDAASFAHRCVLGAGVKAAKTLAEIGRESVCVYETFGRIRFMVAESDDFLRLIGVTGFRGPSSFLEVAPDGSVTRCLWQAESGVFREVDVSGEFA